MITWLTGGFVASELNQGFIAPELTMPTFTLGALLAVALPLAVLVLGAENAQATGVLMV